VCGREFSSELGCLSHRVPQLLSFFEELILTGLQLGQLLAELTLDVLR